MHLTDKSRAILNAIAQGHTYEQILVQDLAWTYHDIFQAAAEALHSSVPNAEKSYDVATIRQDYPRAYELWTSDEDQRLANLFRSTVDELAAALQRQPGAIRSRLAKLNLLTAELSGQLPSRPLPHRNP